MPHTTQVLHRHFVLKYKLDMCNKSIMTYFIQKDYEYVIQNNTCHLLILTQL